CGIEGNAGGGVDESALKEDALVAGGIHLDDRVGFEVRDIEAARDIECDRDGCVEVSAGGEYRLIPSTIYFDDGVRTGGCHVKGECGADCAALSLERKCADCG